MCKFIKKLFNRINKNLLDELGPLGVIYGEDAKVFIKKMEANNKIYSAEETPKKSQLTLSERIIEKSKKEPFINKNH